MNDDFPKNYLHSFLLQLFKQPASKINPKTTKAPARERLDFKHVAPSIMLNNAFQKLMCIQSHLWHPHWPFKTIKPICARSQNIFSAQTCRLKLCYELWGFIFEGLNMKMLLACYCLERTRWQCNNPLKPRHMMDSRSISNLGRPKKSQRIYAILLKHRCSAQTSFGFDGSIS